MKFLRPYFPHFRHILQLSYPIVIGQLGIVLMGVADVLMIGRLDSINLAAASLANAVYFLVAILGIGTLTAVSPLVAKSRGAGHPNQCAILFRQSIIAAFLLGVFISLITYLLTINLHWFKQTDRLTELTRGYLHMLNYGTVPLMLFMAAKQFSDGLGYTKASAVITIFALLLNVLLCWMFIYGNAGAPRLELNGAGVATSVARWVMAFMMVGWVKWNQDYKPWISLKEHEHDRRYLIKIFKVGFPSGMQYFFEVGAFAFAAIMIGWISESAMAAHQVAINIAAVTYMLATGLSAGGSIAVGEALGRKDKHGIRMAGRAAFLLGTIFMGGSALFIGSFSNWITSWYTTDANVALMASRLLIIAALFQLSDGIQCVGLGVLRGIHDTRMPTIITIIAYWGIGIPVGYYFGFNTGWSLYGVWFALLLGLTFSAWMLSRRFLKESNNIDVNDPVYQNYEADAY